MPLNGAAAVALNVTIAAPTAGGYVTVWPSDQPQPATSDLNFTSGQTAANLVVVTMSSDGTVTLFNGSAGSTDLIADVEGYYFGGSSLAPGGFAPVTPARLLDTRAGKVPVAAGPPSRCRSADGVTYRTPASPPCC